MAILGNDDQARCLPIVGMKFDELPEGAPPIYGYEAKWIWDNPADPLHIFECPARIPRKLATEIRSAALGAYQPWSAGTGVGSISAATRPGGPWSSSSTRLPGILPDPRENSCFPKAARAAGLSYDELIRSVADIAWQRISGRSLLAEAAA